MKILVTGGAGFIGSNFVEYMFRNHPNYSITVFDAMTYASNPETVAKFKGRKGFRFIKGDINNTAAVNRAIKGHDWVVNFAAETHVDRSILGPGAFVETNVKGTFNLLEAARNSGVKKFLHISTDEVYGSVAGGKSKEGDMLEPTSPYSSSKAAADLIALSYFRTFGLPVIITRSSNNFGPYQHPEKFIPFFITRAMEGAELPLYGDGKNVRNWIFVEDNCSGLDTALHKGKPGEVYNIGGNVEVPNIMVAQAIAESLGVKTDKIKRVKDRPAHDRRYALDSSKLKKMGWKPRFDFFEALGITIAWYTHNRDWWLALKDKKFREYCRKNYKK
ncbi:MAG: dTDP-glucose 4,6-dehydratase [Spirochaetia bacterium]|nr:dTDP-glucose 4,6-dehydratase [Spirochaetia bacterium]